MNRITIYLNVQAMRIHVQVKLTVLLSALAI